MNWNDKFPNLKSGPDLSTLPKELRHAILHECLQRQHETLEGVGHFLRCARETLAYPKPPEIVAKWHAARLYHYRSPSNVAARSPIIVVPSLINRYYILDLDEERSLVRYFASLGHDVYLLDWNLPTQVETQFSIGDYINEILCPATEFIFKRHAQKPAAIGYCMGGLLTLVMSILYPQNLSRMAVLATPWNFHSKDAIHTRLTAPRINVLREILQRSPLFPGEAILYFFYLSDPWRFQEKFRQFPKLKNKSDRQYFTAIEHWANDCVPLPRKVAVECFVECQQENKPFEKRWRVNDVLIDPTQIQIPCFIAAPQHDRIVPYGSSLALAQHIPHAKVHAPESGHIGMITGARRKSQLWQPLAAWLK
ncbi:MAG: alpha/beta fold hydrolase [Rickettsiales bacterium]|nr:alpha/beta fold hydrolase [Rickettsiales bacterium]